MHDATQPPQNPFNRMWTRPRETVRELVDYNPEYMVLVLASITGIVQALGNAADKNLGDQFGLVAILLLAVFFGAVGGVLSLFIGSALLSLTGRWLGGEGRSLQIRTAIAWSGVPTLALLPFWLVVIAMWGHSFFTEAFPTPGDVQDSLGLMVFGIVQIVLGVWSLVLFFKALAQVQGFESAWRAVGNALLAFSLVFVPMLILVWLTN